MNIEEKAKRYAQSQFRDINSNFTRSDLAQSFTAGYTQSVTDRSAENEKLREALQAMFELVDVARSDNREIRNKAFDKAKLLITEP